MASEGQINIREALSEIWLKVEEAKKRRREHPQRDVCVVAVSKIKPKEAILEAYNCGCRHFGENYVNELVEKATDPEILEMCPDIKWHFIGHLQSNKVKKLISTPNLFMIHTVDSSKLAELLEKAWIKTAKPHALNVMIQVNTSNEESKSGISIDDVFSLYEHILQKCPHLKCVGVMTIGYASYDLTLGPNPEFQMLAKCKDSLCQRFNLDDFHLSMGMSNDFEHAIEMGSTYVRIGTIIFGKREKKTLEHEEH